MNQSLIQQLENGVRQLNLTVTLAQQQKLLQFIALLIKWNEHYNLTAVRDPEQMIIRHLLDSLAIAPYLKGELILDVGSGAGLPGIPLAIYDPSKNFVLLDSNGKKTRFLMQAKIELDLTNISIVQSRIEDFHPIEKFSTITSRAFCSIPDLLTLTANLLMEKGVILGMQGKFSKQQLTSLPKPWQIVRSISLAIPGLAEERHLVIIERG